MRQGDGALFVRIRHAAPLEESREILQHLADVHAMGFVSRFLFLLIKVGEALTLMLANLGSFLIAS